MLGNLFGIQLTLGHLIVGLAMVLAYDLILNILPNPWSEWWTSRSQFPLRVLVFGVVIGLAALVQINLAAASVLAVGGVMMLIGWSWWQATRRSQQAQAQPLASQPAEAKQTPSPSGQPPAETPTSPPGGRPAQAQVKKVKKEKRK